MGRAYLVEVINKLNQFSELKRDWEKVYGADPDAMLFVSWMYLNVWFSMSKDSWFVLAVKEASNGEYIGFLPLKKTSKGKFGLNLYSLINMGTSPLPVYTGFVCRPEKFDDFTKAIVSHLEKDNGWDKLFFANVIDQRLHRFLEGFDVGQFSIDKNKVISSLRLALPDSYEDYLKNSFGRDSRNLMRRKIKRVENNEDMKVTMSSSETIERDAEILIRMWSERWGKEELAKIDHKIILHFFKESRSWIYILWHKSQPIGALSFLEDEQKSTLYAHLTAYDKDFSKVSPGWVVFIKGIQTAITRGYKYFDFAQGLDPYKLAFKAEKVDVFTVGITPKRLKNKLLKILKA